MAEGLITITEADLDKAIKELGGTDSELSRCCILAQALRRTFPVFVSCIASEWWNSRSANTACLPITGAETVVYLFDSRHYEELRRMLPITIHAEVP